MMRYLFLSALILMPMTGAAQQVKIDRDVVDACLLAAQKGDIDPDCIGMAANICQQAPGMSTTIGISDCLMAEQAAWDDSLNREYQSTRAALVENDVIDRRLQAAQRAWIALRDADCDVAGERYGDGSMRTIAYAHCQLNHTARRALDLRNMREY